MSDFKISNIYKSLVRHTVDAMEEAQSRVSPNIGYHAWDSRDEEHELPDNDLVGVSGWTFTENKGLWQVYCGITISTFDDVNLLREVDIVDVIHDFFGEGLTVPLRDDGGNEHSQLMVNEFELLVAGQTEKRNYRPLGLSLLRVAND